MSGGACIIEAIHLSRLRAIAIRTREGILHSMKLAKYPPH